MKSFFGFLFILLLILFSAGTVAVFALTKEPVVDWDSSIELHILNNDVLVKHGNLDYQLMNEDMSLEVGDMVKTDKTGEAEIIVGDASVFRLAPNTEIKVDKADLDEFLVQDVKFTLLSGNIWARIIKIFDNQSKWEVETPTVVATARGTAFSVSYDGDLTDVLVAESKVELSNKKANAKWKNTIVELGQNVKINKNLEIQKDLLDVKKIKDLKKKEWLEKNLKKDKEFRIKAQEELNNKLLRYLNEEPGSKLYKAQILAENIKSKILPNSKNLEELKKKRRVAEALWLAKKNDYTELKTLLNNKELKTLKEKDKGLFIELLKSENIKDNEIKKLLPEMKDRQDVFDLKTLDREINSIDFNNLKLDSQNDGLKFLSEWADDSRELKTTEISDFQAILKLYNEHPEEFQRLEELSNILDSYSSEKEMLNSPEYAEYMAIAEKLNINFADPMEDSSSSFNFVK